MVAYVVAVIEARDAAAFEAYRGVALPIVKRFGGRSLLHGTEHVVLEGTWRPGRVVVIEFPSAAQARAFHDSEEYAAAKALRQACAQTDMLLFEGGAPR